MAERERLRHVTNLRQLSQPSPQTTSNPSIKPIRQIVKRKKRSLYNAKGLLTLCGLGVFAMLFGQLYLDAQINRVHRQVEQTRFTISRESTTNEQLKSHVAELSQHARIIEIANERGLMFNENIIYIQR